MDVHPWLRCHALNDQSGLAFQLASGSIQTLGIEVVVPDKQKATAARRRVVGRGGVVQQQDEVDHFSVAEAG
jgi:hypothetical protein